MFSNLNPDELEVVLGAMQKVSFQPGAKVIVEGDDGDNLYVVETGKLACTKRIVSSPSLPPPLTSFFRLATGPRTRPP